MSSGIAVFTAVAGLISVIAVLSLLALRQRAGLDAYVRACFLAFLSSLLVFLTGLGMVADAQIAVPIIIMGGVPLAIVVYMIYKMPPESTLRKGSWHIRAAGAATGIALVSGGIMLRVGLESMGIGPLALVGIGALVVFLSLVSTSTEKRGSPGAD